MRSWPFVLLLFTLGAAMQAAHRPEGSKTLHDLFAAAWDSDMQERPEEGIARYFSQDFIFSVFYQPFGGRAQNSFVNLTGLR